MVLALITEWIIISYTPIRLSGTQLEGGYQKGIIEESCNTKETETNRKRKN